jgi:hypothetical protein
MAVASSASVSLQQRTAAVFSSSFVKGTNASSCGGGLRLSSSPSVSFGVGNVCPRVTAMATKRVIKSTKPGRKLSWLPGVKGGGNFVDPEWLDGSYVSLSLDSRLICHGRRLENCPAFAHNFCTWFAVFQETMDLIL